MKPSEKRCPIMVDQACLTGACALFRGKDEDGLCAVNDLAGWMKNVNDAMKLIHRALVETAKEVEEEPK